MTEISLIWSPLSTSMADLAPADVLSTLVDAAKKLVQFGPLGAKGTPEAYAQAIGCDLEAPSFRSSFVLTKPNTDPNWPTSSCGLTMRSLLLHFRCTAKRLQPPYRNGMVMSDLEQTFRDSHGWLTGTLPFPGCIVFYGPYVGKTNGQHVEMITDFDGSVGTATAGGQDGGFGGGTEIGVVRRTFTIEGGQVYASKDGKKRIVRGLGDPSTLDWGQDPHEPVVVQVEA